MPAENALGLSKLANPPFDRLRAHAVSHAAWDVGAEHGVPATYSVSDLGTATRTGSGREGDQRRRRRAVPKTLRMISVPAVRANCLKALESVICSTIDFSARCGLRDRARLAAGASRSARASALSASFCA